MITIGLRKETKSHEYRVALNPGRMLDVLCTHGYCRFIVEEGAGLASGFSNDDYDSDRITIVTRDELFEQADIVLGVKELDDDDLNKLSKDQTDVCFQHFAAHDRTPVCKQLAFEEYCVDGKYPILQAMSRIAGKLAILEGSRFLLNHNGGNGVMLEDSTVVVIGAGVVGLNAAVKALALGADVSIVDIDLAKLRTINELYPEIDTFRYWNKGDLNVFDIVVGAAYVPKQKAPKLIDTKKMKSGSILVDVSIDQGGSSDTSRPTTHDEPTYIENDVIHYCVPNIPGIVGKSSSYYLSFEVERFIKSILDGI